MNKDAGKKRYKVLLLAAGAGLRLGELTKYTNKSLIRIGKKPVISYIIESYPKETEIVVTVGYFASQVKEFISLAYPDRKITFVDIDKYQGEGSSIGYSILKAKKHLQCPFIYHACDTIVNSFTPKVESNWIGGFRGENSSIYASFDVIGNRVGEIKDKGAINSDFLYIGLLGIKDYKAFWDKLEEMYQQNPNDQSLNDYQILNGMTRDGIPFEAKELEAWFDTGNIESLNHARKNIRDSIPNLDKVDESIFIFDDFVIKFFYDQKLVRQRVERAKILKGLVPTIESSTKNFYRYKFIPGDLYSRVVNPSDLHNFLLWSKQNLWKKNKKYTTKKFKEVCYDFYKTKTLQRVKKFLDKKGMRDTLNTINGEEVPALVEILKKVDFDWLSGAEQYNFHGDFILDNIIKTKDRYYLLDWRQNFGGLLESGDMYYDLAKLNHNLTVSHDIIHKNLYTIKIVNHNIECDIMRNENFVACQQEFQNFLIENSYDLRKVKILTALIWLNMSPLHQHPLDLFLFYFGKLNLWRMVK